ncbi:hypothetical protein AC1031_004714 [Aphanomyces cochlioides]|nr:hypothetical protein AC1031_004714 [Aphanomyces cochlioides]
MTLPPLTAHHGILVYVKDTLPMDGLQFTAIHATAKLGCNGSLVVLEDKTAATPFERVLGIQNGASILRTRSIPHVVLCTSADTCAKLSNAATMELIPAEALPSRIIHHLTHAKQNIVVVHLSVAEYSSALDECFASLQKTIPLCYLGFVKETNVNLPLATPTIPAMFPRPKQSWQKRDGEYAIDDKIAATLVYSFCLEDQTRQDTLESFNEMEIVQRGGYGTMQAHVALQEIAFRLGYVPKYGA